MTNKSCEWASNILAVFNEYKICAFAKMKRKTEKEERGKAKIGKEKKRKKQNKKP